MGRKKNTDTNGTTTAPGGWGAVAEASAAKDRPAPVQTRLELGGDSYTVEEHHDIEVPVSAAEAVLLNALSTEETAKALALEAEVKKLREELLAPKIAAAKAHRAKAETAAKEAATNRRTVTMKILVEYHPNTARKRFLHAETRQPIKLDETMTAQELEIYAQVRDPSPEERVDLEPDGEPEDAESAS